MWLTSRVYLDPPVWVSNFSPKTKKWWPVGLPGRMFCWLKPGGWAPSMARSLVWKGLETLSLPFAPAGAVCLSAANAVFTNARSLYLHEKQLVTAYWAGDQLVVLAHETRSLMPLWSPFWDSHVCLAKKYQTDMEWKQQTAGPLKHAPNTTHPHHRLMRLSDHGKNAIFQASKKSTAFFFKEPYIPKSDRFWGLRIQKKDKFLLPIVLKGSIYTTKYIMI